MTRVDTRGMGREEWLALRRGGLGGTDAATIAGCNPYGSLAALYADKKGLTPDRDTPAYRVGRDLEETVAALWRERTGKRCRRVRAMYRAADAEYFIANIDRRVVGENAALECKVTGPWNRADFAAGEIPDMYVCQCQWYMMVCGFARMYLAVLRLGEYGLYDFVVERDEARIEALRRAGRAFWEEHVLPGAPPPPDGSDSSAEAVRKICGPCAPGACAQLTAQEEDLREYDQLGARIEALKRRREAAAQRVQLALGASETGESRDYVVRWASQPRVTLDGKALKAALPEVYQVYAKTGAARVFRVRAKRGKGGAADGVD